MMRMHTFRRRALALAIGAATGLGAAGPVWSATAGTIQFVNGDVFILRGAATLPAKRGDLVQEGDQIQSGADGFAQLRMSDDAYVSVRRDTTLKVERYQYSGADSGKTNENDGAILSLVKGTFRSFTGALTRANKKSYVMYTPNATIGIRGTGNITTTNGVSTENYTVTGSHTIRTTDASGRISTFITTPNQNVVVRDGIVQIVPPSLSITSASGGQPGGKPAAPVPGGTDGASGGAGGSSGGTGGATGGSIADTVASVSGTPVAGTATTGTSMDTTSTGAAAVGGVNIGTGTGPAAVPTSPPAVLTGCNTATDPACATALNLTAQTTQTGSTTTPITGTTQTGTTTTTIIAVPALSLFTPDIGGTVVFGVGSGLSSSFINFGFSTPASLVRRDAAGNLTGWSYNSTQNTSSNTSFDIVGPVVLEARTQAASFATTGIEYGRLGGSSVTIGGTSPGSIPLGPAGAHWITAVSPTPPYMPEALTGTATYRLDGGTRPTDGAGTLGTLNSATLSANFTTQSVNAAVNVTVAGTGSNWVGTGTNMPMSGESFSGASPIPGCTVNCTNQQGAGTVSVTLNGVAASGNMNGRFAGPNANGAMLSYNFNNTGTTAFNTVGGVAAFVNSGSNVDPGVILTGVVGGLDANGISIFSDSDMINANNPSRVVTNAAGSVTAFDARTGFNNSATGLTSSLVPAGMPVTVSLSGTATESGIDALSGVQWGRWNSYTVTARPDGSVLPVSGTLHFLIAPPGLATMPQTGAFNYALAGNTQPTNDAGGVGTLNSASMAANFSSKTVSVSLNTTVAGTTLNGAANNMPIEAIIFNAGPNSVVPMTVTCTGTCGATNTGGLGGSFVGPAAQTAALGYRMATLSAAGSTVNSAAGVAVFHRQ